MDFWVGDLEKLTLSELKKLFDYCSEQLNKPMVEPEVDKYRETIRVIQFLAQYKR